MVEETSHIYTAQLTSQMLLPFNGPKQIRREMQTKEFMLAPSFS